MITNKKKEDETISINISGLYMSELSPINRLYFIEKLQNFLNDNINDNYMIYQSDRDCMFDTVENIEYYDENNKRKYNFNQLFKIQKVTKKQKLKDIKKQRDTIPIYPNKYKKDT